MLLLHYKVERNYLLKLEHILCKKVAMTVTYRQLWLWKRYEKCMKLLRKQSCKNDYSRRNWNGYRLRKVIVLF